MEASQIMYPQWLITWMKTHDISLWGYADLRNVQTPADRSGKSFPYALSFAIAMTPKVMFSVQNGPNQAYADEYANVNARINTLAELLADELEAHGWQARALAASVRTDPVKIAGEFPHKTAATRAGLGWIGKNCQLVTRMFGPWVRLGTVFTDASLPCSKPIDRHFCGSCMRCIEACPAHALKGGVWSPGTARDILLDAQACDQWKKEHYFQYHRGHNCGICSAVCPYGQKVLKRQGMFNG